jgi:hypothetical protein
MATTDEIAWMCAGHRQRRTQNAVAARLAILTAGVAVIMVMMLAGCGGSTPKVIKTPPATSSAPSPTPDPAASMLYNALSAADSNVSSDPTSLANYANGVCKSLGKIALVSLQAGQDAYRLGIANYKQKGYTLIQARAVMNAIIYSYCPQWDQLTNTPSSGG